MSELADTVSRLEQEALARLTEVLSGTALCRVDGPDAHVAKHWEGRSAALAQARRAMRRTTPQAHRAVIGTVRQDWAAQLANVRGEQWSIYTTAGLAALDEAVRG